MELATASLLALGGPRRITCDSTERAGTHPQRRGVGGTGTEAVLLDPQDPPHEIDARAREVEVGAALRAVPTGPVRPLFDHTLAVRAGRPGVGGP